MKIETEWTGKYPYLCCGKWKLFVDEKDMSDIIPEDMKYEPMMTRGTYKRYHLDDDWIKEECDEYEDGYYCNDWISENYDWISKITTNRTTLADVYLAFKTKDWRYDLCGGCLARMPRG